MKTFRMFASLLIVLLVSAPTKAQRHAKNQPIPSSIMKKIEIKMKDMGNRLQLDLKTLDTFLPMYRQYLKEVYRNSSSFESRTRFPDKRSKNINELTDEEMEDLFERHLKVQEKEYKTQKKYYKKFKKILNMRQVYQVLEATSDCLNLEKSDGPVPLDEQPRFNPGRIQDKNRLPVRDKIQI